MRSAAGLLSAFLHIACGEVPPRGPERPPVPQAYRTAARRAHRDAARPRHRPVTYRVTPRMPDPADAFETWLLRRVADDIEGNEVSADLLKGVVWKTEVLEEVKRLRAKSGKAR